MMYAANRLFHGDDLKGVETNVSDMQNIWQIGKKSLHMDKKLEIKGKIADLSKEKEIVETKHYTFR
ncbi:MAG: hypothetical protein SOR93_04780 [Clostridiales Family XIII bacterium]|nr:hypothetical protein [Clostridia bacterium]MDY3010566.1 hypothetical protein [Clostridiales Family XIII bacterium]